MLARPNRLTRGAEYKAVVRRGRRCAAAHTVVYALASDEDAARFGFIVNKQVGSAVTRNTVRRRLKAISLDLLPTLRPGTDVVIRALPAAATTPFDVLRSEVVRGLRRVA